LGRYLLIRVISSVITVLAATFFVFGVSRTAQDPLDLYIPESGYGITEEGRIAIGKELNLDRAVPVAYVLWLGKAVRGDLGKSLVNKRPVTSVISEKIPNTLQLGLVSWVLATVIGVPMGILSAVKRGTLWDYIGRGFALFGQAIPNFWFAIISILIFAVWLGWLPSATKQGLDPMYFILPAITLGSAAAAGYLRITRSAMLEVLDMDYIVMARAKGVDTNAVIWKHALRNALIPPLTVSSLILTGFITGSVLVEVVFAWPGLGRLAVNSVNTNDFPVLTAVMLMFTVLYVVVNFITDILYVVIDPRIRLS
jgi:ABC-type dipeptide/oligopeptide/nickel transport system permease component